MVRRWSCINNIEISKLNWRFFINRFNITSLTLSVRYKKYSWKFSYLKRRHWAKRKHISIWYHYFIILSSWSLFYRSIRQLFKYQYYYNIQYYNFLWVNPKHYGAIKKLTLDCLNFYNSTSVSRKILQRFFSTPINNDFNLTLYFSDVIPTPQKKKKDHYAFNLQSVYDREVYDLTPYYEDHREMVYKKPLIFNSFGLGFKQAIEIYKITLYLFFFKIIK